MTGEHLPVEEATALLDERMAAARVEHDIPALAYGLLHRGALVHATGVDGAGVLDRARDRPFRIASMSKSLTAATVLSLRDEGRLALDDPIATHLPWAASIGSPAGSPVPTVRHLLTMTAGFPTDDPWGDRQEPLPIPAFDALVAGGLSFCRPPGPAFEYSNLGYALLGRVISQVTGADFRDVVRERLLDPLGMTRSTYDVDATIDRMIGYAPRAAGLIEQPETPSGAFSPMGGLWSTVTDLSRWVGVLLGAWEDDASVSLPVSRWSLLEMQRSQVHAGLDTTVGGQPHSPVASNYGMGLYVSEDVERGRFVHHSGGYPGFGSHMRWHPESGWAVIALANRTYAPMGRVAAGALDAIVDAQGTAGRRTAAVARMWPQTRSAMGLAESLLGQWDDAALDAQAAVNLDLDQPRGERRAEWVERAAALGGFSRVEDSVESRSPAHARWQLTGPGGTAWLEVLMTPEREPRIQTLAVSEVEAAD